MRVKVLIIDEGTVLPFVFPPYNVDCVSVSMVDGDLFDKLARVGSIIRKKTEPFGGIQVIFHIHLATFLI